MSSNSNSNSSSSSSSSNDAASQRKIFIGGLNYNTDDEKLRKYFSAYGTVQEAVVMKDPISRRSRGFGFITFCDIDSVDNALAHEPHTIDSRKVEAKRAVPRSDLPKEITSTSPTTPAAPIVTVKSVTASPVSAKSTTASVVAASNNVSNVYQSNSLATNATSWTQSTQAFNTVTQVYMHQDNKFANDPRINSDEYAYHKIFVGGLHYDTRDAEFRSYFEKFGKVLTAEVMFNRETHKSRGFGFIVFELEKGAEAVCAEKEHIIDGKVVEVKRAIPRAKLPPGSTSPVVSSSTYTSNIPVASTTTTVRPTVANSKPSISSTAIKPVSPATKLVTTQSSVNGAASSKWQTPLGASGIKSTFAFSYAAAVKGSEVDDEFLLSHTDQFYENQPISNLWEESSADNMSTEVTVSHDSTAVSANNVARIEGKGTSRSNSYEQSPSFSQNQNNAGFTESLLPPATSVSRVNNAGIGGQSSSTNAWGTQNTSTTRAPQAPQTSLLTGINWLSAVGSSADGNNASGFHDGKANSFSLLHPEQVMKAPTNMMPPQHYSDMHHKYQQQQQHVQQPMPNNAMLGGRVVHMPAYSQGHTNGVQNEWVAGYGPPGKDHSYGIDQHQYYPPQQPHQVHMQYSQQQDQRPRLYTPQPPYGHQPMPIYSNDPNQGYNMVSSPNIALQLPSYRNVTLAQPSQVQAQPHNPLGLPVTSSDIRTDDLFAFKDLRLDAAEFDPNFAWNNRGNGNNNNR